LDGSKRFNKDIRHLRARKVSGSEHDGDHARLFESAQFIRAMSDAGVLGENDPIFAPNLSEPFFVRRISLKMSVVDFDKSARFS